MPLNLNVATLPGFVGLCACRISSLFAFDFGLRLLLLGAAWEKNYIPPTVLVIGGSR